jgi:hypothetical protein
VTGGVAALLAIGLVSGFAGLMAARMYSASRVTAYWWGAVALMTWGCAISYAAGLVQGRWG